jgi:predicted AAA+ superfamily ATPase
LGIFVGALLSGVIERKGKIIMDNTPEFIDYCLKSNGVVFFGSVGSGKTAILAMLAYHSPIENKYASFPCSLPWMKRYQLALTWHQISH